MTARLWRGALTPCSDLDDFLFRDVLPPAIRPGVHRNPGLVEVVEQQGRHAGEAENLTDSEPVVAVEDGPGHLVNKQRQIHMTAGFELGLQFRDALRLDLLVGLEPPCPPA